MSGAQLVRVDAAQHGDLRHPFAPASGDPASIQRRTSDGRSTTSGRGVDLASMASKRMPLGGRRAELGVIDYTLAKRALLRDARIGVLGLTDVCDAHPELMRAARHVGEPTNNDCPVCAKEKLVLLAYVYGDGLKADSGRVWSIETGLRMTAAHPGRVLLRGRGVPELPVEPPQRGVHRRRTAAV